MKRKKLLKTSSIVLVLALLMSTILSAFADTTNSNAASDSGNKWVTKTSMVTPRNGFQTEVVNGKIYVIGGNNSSIGALSSVEEYDPTTDKWTAKTSMAIPRFYFQAEVVNGKIYVIGGHNSNGETLSSVEEYDPLTDKWTTKMSMANARFQFQTGVINQKIYAIGGTNSSGSVLSSVEEYDPLTDKWTTKSPLSTARYIFKTEMVDGKIYAMGGRSSADLAGNPLSSVEAYDPTTDKWTARASMSTTRGEFQTELINGKIYVMGGSQQYFDVIPSVEEYDPATDKWIAKAEMSTPRRQFQTTLIDNKIYAIGGMISSASASSVLSSAEEYNPAIDKWTSINAMSTPRREFLIQVINGKIYAIGGYNKSELSSVEEYTAAEPTQSPTLTVTPSSDKVKINDQFTTTVAIHKGTNICAEDIKLTYDTNLFEYVGADAQKGLKIMKEDSTTTPGTIRFIVSCLGKDNAATGDKDLITLKFKAKRPGQGKVDITKGRIADNATLEMDVADADCGEATITVESNKDVNRSGDVTLLDLGIDSWYYGSDAKDTDSTKYDADVMPNGKIDDDDLSEITNGILSNSKYPNN